MLVLFLNEYVMILQISYGLEGEEKKGEEWDVEKYFDSGDW